MLPPSLPTRLLLLLGVVLLATPARAKPEFPGIVSNQLQLSYLPPCSVCHLTNKTSSATVTTAFGYALRERGFSDGGSLPLALQRLADDRADSDGDGVTDVQELEAGTDPSSKANASLVKVADPEFGCSTPRPTRTSPVALLSVLAVIAATRRFARRSKPARRVVG